MKSVPEFLAAKGRRRLSLVTAYDALSAKAAAASDIDAILVGDSVAMVVHGFPTTLHATLEMLTLHVAAVRRGAPDLLVIADLPFLSTRRGIPAAIDAAGALLRAGANAVKLEGLAGHAEVVAQLVASGIPVMGHLGLTPQAFHQLGHRVQGRDARSAARIRADARQLAQLGVFALVLECVPARLARRLTTELAVPTIGIGAGRDTDGQVLVWSDLHGLDPAFRPSFARAYQDGHAAAVAALNAYARDVVAGRFPGSEEIIA